MIGYLALIGFAATIPAANWMIGHIGTFCVPNGPCLIPVGFGFSAPSGVLMIGLALVLRDMVQERLGMKWALGAIVSGAALSGFLAPGPLVVASAASFLIAELADLSVYTPLRKRGLWLAVLASGVVGAIVDSALFLLLAFGSLDHLTGTVIGKMWVTLAAALYLYVKKRANQGVSHEG